MNRTLPKEMFSEMVLKKDISLASRHYQPDFVLETNGQRQDYAAFVARSARRSVNMWDGTRTAAGMAPGQSGLHRSK